MNGGGPAAAAAVSLSCSERYFLSPAAAAVVAEAAERSWCTGKAEKGAQPRLSALLCALCALESRVTLPTHPCCHRFHNLCMVGGFSISVTTYRMLRCWGVFSCDSVSLRLSQGKAERWWRSGRLLLLLVTVVWVLTLICVTSLSLSRHSTSFPLSLFTSLHITHTCMHAHIDTHTYTPRFGQITQGWGTKGRRRQFVSSPEQACHRANSTAGQPASPNSQHLQLSTSTTECIQPLHQHTFFMILHNDETSLASQELRIAVWSGPTGPVGIRIQLGSHIGQSSFCKQDWQHSGWTCPEARRSSILPGCITFNVSVSGVVMHINSTQSFIIHLTWLLERAKSLLASVLGRRRSPGLRRTPRLHGAL